MKSRTTKQFLLAFGKLPLQVQEQARAAYRQFKKNPAHPSLRFNPRVVKKPRSKLKSKKRSHRTGITQLQPLTFAPIPSAA